MRAFQEDSRLSSKCVSGCNVYLIKNVPLLSRSGLEPEIVYCASSSQVLWMLWVLLHHLNSKCYFDTIQFLRLSLLNLKFLRGDVIILACVRHTPLDPSATPNGARS